ncbi:hypothetical protein HYZ80_04085 [Candidatus Parcubacteria bacterium]|nr:hypothetical protein [Candidatus Parcubacteria bacterium]
MTTVGPEARAQWDRPPVPLADPETGKKIKLQLRVMSFHVELDKLPASMLEVHKIFTSSRTNKNAETYKMVSAWQKLSRHERYWTTFQFQTEAEYLVYYDLPDGATLGRWYVLVSLFDRATFVLLGPDVLYFMTQVVMEYQSDTDTRKNDYQAIFDQYCRVHDSFDKAAFYKVMRGYVEEKYPKRQAGTAGEGRENGRGRDVLRPGRQKERVVTHAPKGQKVGPTIEFDFAWKERRCPSCAAKITVIKAFQEHALLLEGIIRKKLGSKHVPQRPAVLKDL